MYWRNSGADRNIGELKTKPHIIASNSSWKCGRMPCMCLALGLLLLTVSNMYSSEPLFFTIDDSSWSIPEEETTTSASTKTSAVTAIGKGVEDVLRNISSSPTSFAYERGFEMCVADDPAMITSAVYMVSSLRNFFKSKLPISIVHCAELSNASKKRLIEANRYYPMSSSSSSSSSDSQSIRKGGADASASKSEAESPLLIRDICSNASAAQKKRLRGYYCKPMAVVTSLFRWVMVIDTDVIWYNNPELLFYANLFEKYGALFFRDRFVFEPKEEREDRESNPLQQQQQKQKQQQKKKPPAVVSKRVKNKGLVYNDVKLFVEKHTGWDITPEKARQLEIANGVNLFWRHGSSSGREPGLMHIVESSCVIFDRLRMNKTVSFMREHIPSFSLGYGEKELFWIAATIVEEPFTMEPFLVGFYGDCGEMMHFNPFNAMSNSFGGNTLESASSVYYINGQYLVEGVSHAGGGLQDDLSVPVRATESTRLFEMGPYNPVTAGLCGACKEMGCTKTPDWFQEVIVKQQAHMLQYVNVKDNDSTWSIIMRVIYKVIRMIVPAAML